MCQTLIRLRECKSGQDKHVSALTAAAVSRGWGTDVRDVIVVGDC